MNRLIPLLLLSVAGWSALNAPAQAVFTIQPAPQSVSLGANTTFTAVVIGAPPFVFQWLKDGAELAGSTTTDAATAKLELTDVQLVHAAKYQVRATDANGRSTVSEPAVLTVDPTFTKITKSAIVEDVDKSVGCAWGDIDNDGYPDLFVTSLGSRNALYRNNGDGTFTRITTGPMWAEPISGVPYHGCAWADIDNDGWLDLYVSHIGAVNLLYHNLGGGQFEKVLPSVGGDAVQDIDRSVGHAWADVNGDGLIDLFVPNGGFSRAENGRLYLNMGDRRFNRTSAGPPTDELMRSMQAVWADVNGDGKPDLFVTHQGRQPNSLFLNNGDGTFLQITNSPVTTETLNSMGAAWGDYDNNGFPDLIVTHYNNDGSNARNSLFRNRGDGTFEQITQGDIVNDTGAFFGCAWVDYDNDGFLDLFVVAYNQRRLLYHNNGDGTFTRLTEGSLVNDVAYSVGCAWADINNDGFLDLFVANGGLDAAQANSLYRNNGNSNAWLKVRCVGTLSNRSAIGAKIRVKATFRGAERWQLREISGGSGAFSQDSLVASFGLGDANVIDTVWVEWPSGIVQELHNQPVRKTLDLVEPIPLLPTVTIAAGIAELQLSNRTARPLLVEASSDLIGWTSLGTVVPQINKLRVPDHEARFAQDRFYRVRVP